MIGENSPGRDIHTRLKKVPLLKGQAVTGHW